MAKKHEMKAKMHKRAKGGAMVEEGAGEKDADFKKAARKHGGKVHGEKSMHRPDKRARGGATSDMDPLTTAGKMSSLPYESKQAPKTDEGGKGAGK